MTIQNPHSEAAQKAMKTLRQYTDSLDGWKLILEKDGAKIYSKNDSSPFPLSRGDYTISGTQYTPEQISTVAAYLGTRKIWDENSNGGEIKEMYSCSRTRQESLYWSKVKAPWPVTPRDMVAVTLRESTAEGDVYIAITSVKDSSCPETSAYVRSNVMLCGWKIYNSNGGIGLTYIAQIDVAGSIPSYLLKKNATQIPLGAYHVGKYVKEHGFAPSLESNSCDVKDITLEHSKKECIIELDGAGDASIVVCKKMYPSGVKVKISGKASYKVVGEKVTITGVNGPNTVKITKA